MLRSVLIIICWIGSAAIYSSGVAHAASYSEFISGDLPGVGSAPQPLTLQVGSNQLLGMASALDYDFLRITIPANHTLDSVIVVHHEDINQVFAGVQAGGTWTAGTGDEINKSLLLGWVDFPTNPHHAHTGEDILDDIAVGAGSIGFATPLGSGVYTMLFQTGTGAVSYGLSFNVSQIGGVIPGDFNGDSVVDGADLARWKAAFGKNATADGNNDGVSDGRDFAIWQRNFSLTGATPTAHTIPEAAGVVLAGFALTGLSLCQRCRSRRAIVAS